MASGAGSTGPSGRSPFPPSRNPRSRTARSSLGDGSVVMDESSATAHSPFLQGLLRFSPNNSGWSPNNSRMTARPRTRFFDSSNNNNNHHHHPGAPSADASNNAMTTNPQKTNDAMETTDSANVQDGIPIDYLRMRSTQELLQSPSQASFFASILYSKTGHPDDALLLAQVHLINQKYSACLRILEDSTLLQSDYPWEAILVACAALAATDEWSALVEVLEDACRIPSNEPSSDNDDNNGETTNNNNTFAKLAASQPLEDDDEMGWQALQLSIIPAHQSIIHPLARLCWWRGQAYHETGHGLRAAVYWKRALRIDCQCQSAWEALLSRQLLTPSEAYGLLQELDFTGKDWLRSLYLARIELTPQDPDVSKQQQQQQQQQNTQASSFDAFDLHGSQLDASSIQMSSPMPTFNTPAGEGLNLTSTTTAKKDVTALSSKVTTTPIQENVDEAFGKLWNVHKLQHCPQVLAMAARRAYRCYDWRAALEYCEELDQLDPAMPEAAYCYVATLTLLGHKRTLFRLAHEWVNACPKAAQSWFAVGAYYYCCERYHVAQRHFCRATRLDPQSTEAWIAFGCSFAACDESDQALASFRAAQRLSPGEHTSLLYMGMEYVRTNHLVLAQYFLQASLTASGGDPLCLHELGVLALQRGEHETAISWFERALAAIVGGDSTEESIELCQDPYWEPTLFNLGHAYRKTRQFEEASGCFARCVALCPDKFSTHAALAFTKHLMRDLDGAIECYHQALGCKPDDPFSTEMLNRALQEAMTEGLSLEDVAQTNNKGSSLEDSPWLKKDDSTMSEDMDIDVHMKED